MRVVFTISLFMILLGESYAQRWRECRIILTTSDTIIGKAILKSDSLIVQMNSGQKKEYPIDDVQNVMLGEVILKNSRQLGIPDTGKPFLAEALLEGDTRLYLKNQQDPSFFIQTENSKFIELTRTFKDVQKDGLNYRLSYDAYRNQLKDLFKDCPTFTLDPKRNYFTQPKMIELTKKYSICKNQRITFEKKFKKSNWVSLVGGMGITSINFTLSNSASVVNTYPYFNNTSSNSSSPFFGLHFETASGYEQNWRVFAEALLKKTSTTVSDAHFDVGYLKVNLGLKRLIFSTSKAAVDIHGGICFNPILNVSSNKTPSFRTNEFGGFLGLGYTFGRIGFFIRDEITNGFINTSTIHSMPNTIYFGARVIVF